MVPSAALLRDTPSAPWPDAREDSIVAPASARAALPPEFVRRRTLVRRLTDAPGGAIVLIVAPPGYGKSSLLADWAQRDDREFVWLTVGRSAQTRPSGEWLGEVIASAEAPGRGCVVVLDDVHRVSPRVLREFAAASLGALGPQSTLALSSRTEPELPIGRLRAHRALVEIGPAELAMAPAEAARLIRRAGFRLDADAAADLMERTEGWPAALYLAALSLGARHRAPAGVIDFRGDNHLVGEYLRDEVLLALGPEQLSLLVRTSVLDELSGPVCDAVLETHGSAAVLAGLARTTGLLAPLDASHASYRVHSLLRDNLQAELRRREPQAEPELHRRAGAWYSERGDVDRAIGHACAGRDAALAGRLLWRSILPHLARGENARVVRWLSCFSRDQIAADARLSLCAAYSRLVAGDVEEAGRCARTAALALGRAHGDDHADEVRIGLAVLEASAARGGVAMSEAIARVNAHEPDDCLWLALCWAVHGIAEHLSGDRRSAGRRLDAAIALGGSAVPGATALALAQRAVIAIEDGEWEAAGDLTDRAVRLLDDPQLGAEPLAALVFAAAAAVRAHQGRVDEAKRDLRAGLERLAALGDFTPWYSAETRILLAWASLWLADVAEARSLLAHASRLVRRIPDTPIFQHWFDEAWSYLDTLAEESLAGPSSLTIAELKVLRFLPSHRSFREIATQLGISPNTVKTQAHSLYRKLGATSRSEAVALACDAGLLGQ